jgi:hypothetical protein
MTICFVMNHREVLFGYLSSTREALESQGNEVRLLSFRFRDSEEDVYPVGQSNTDVVTLDATGELDCERADIEALTHFQVSSSYSTFFGIAMKTLDRHDYYGVLRHVDRVILIKQSLLTIFSYLLRHRPRMVVFLNTPHLFGDFLTYEVANYLGIRTMHFQPTPLCPAMLVRSRIGVAATPVSPLGGRPEVFAEVSRILEKRTQQLLDWKNPPYIEGQMQGSRGAQSFGGRIRGWIQSARWLFTPRFKDSPELVFEGSQPTIAVNPLRLFLSVNLEKSLRRTIAGLDSSEPAQELFAIFALHYEPERTVTPEGLPYVHQEDAILRARTLLPDEVTLVVKEHYSQATSSLRGQLGRSPRFYQTIRSLPNTVVVGTYKLPKSVIQRAQAVFTMTGTVGIEAANLGVPVGFFGSPWWEGLPGTLRIGMSTEYGNIQELRMIGKDSAFAFFRKLVSEQMIPGISSESPQSYQIRNTPLSHDLLSESADAITAQILNELSSISPAR